MITHHLHEVRIEDARPGDFLATEMIDDLRAERDPRPDNVNWYDSVEISSVATVRDEYASITTVVLVDAYATSLRVDPAVRAIVRRIPG